MIVKLVGRTSDEFELETLGLRVAGVARIVQRPNLSHLLNLDVRPVDEERVDLILQATVQQAPLDAGLVVDKESGPKDGGMTSKIEFRAFKPTGAEALRNRCV